MSTKKTKKQTAKAVQKPELVKRRIGTIVIATAVLDNAESRAMLCQTLFQRFCPFFISVSPTGDRRAFTGFCDDFAEIFDGEIPPRYLFGVNTDATGKRTISFTPMNPAFPAPEAPAPTATKPPRKPRKG